MTHQTAIIAGSNLGDSLTTIKGALQSIAGLAFTDYRFSSIYKTAPWGNTDQPAFYNQIIIGKSLLPSIQLMDLCLDIEQQHGRIRGKDKYGPRVLDLDILFYENLVLNNPKLTIPHNQLNNRRFVLEPLVELAPDWIHPITKESAMKLLENCTDSLSVDRIE